MPQSSLSYSVFVLMSVFVVTYQISRYENCKRTLQAQLSKNDQSIKDTPSDSVSLKGLHTRLQEIQVQF